MRQSKIDQLRYLRDLSKKVTPGLAFDILRYPHVTQKTVAMGQNGVMVFIVDKKYNKIDIKKACEIVFEQEVAKVNVQIKKNKKKRFKGKEYIKADVKKAMVFFKDKEVVNKVMGEAK